MKRTFLAVYLFNLMSLALIGCGLFNAKTLKTVLDAADIACIIANAELTDSDVSKVCELSDDLREDVHKVLASHRMGVAKVGGPLCKSDGGADAEAGTDGGLDAAKDAAKE